MRLRARFAVAFALAAVVPIAVAAGVTRQMVAQSLREDHRKNLAAIDDALHRELRRGDDAIVDAARGLASREHPMVGGILRELVKLNGVLDSPAHRRLREQEQGFMRGLGLDVLTVTDGRDQVLSAPHLHTSTIGDRDPIPAQRAAALGSRAFYARQRVMSGDALESPAPLMVASAAIVRDGEASVAVLVARRIGEPLLSTVRRAGQVDARIVASDGQVLVPPAEPSWPDAVTPIRVELAGADGRAVAAIELAVADRGLDRVLLEVTVVSALLAALALAISAALGVYVARRMTRDLDRLVDGANALARGEHAHRVTVSTRDEVGELASAFNRMTEEVESAKQQLVVAERIAAWQEIARRLAHEIKNPLTPIQMAMDNLRKTWQRQHAQFPEILAESTQTVLEEAERLRRIVSEFSDFARMPKPELAAVDLNDVVASTLALYQGAPVERRLADKLPAIAADRGQLSQVVLNLVENARDAIAGNTDGRITVATRALDDDRVELAVEDNGPGVPAEVRERVFTPYFTTKHGKGGTGLGLAIVQRIVADHAGKIVVGEAAGGGARFAVELPAKR